MTTRRGADTIGLTVPDTASREIGALLHRHGLQGRPCAVAYLAFADPGSCIGAWEPDGKLEPLIGFLPLPLRGEQLLDAIAHIDESGPRLVARYRRSFAADADRLASFDAGLDIDETSAPAWLLAAGSLALGLTDADVARALQPRVETVAVDTFVIDSERGYVVDGRRLLRSLMSYRIGGVAGHVLARSVFDSLGRFVADAIGRLVREWRPAAVVCAGDLFAGNVILHARTRRGLAQLQLPIVGPAWPSSPPARPGTHASPGGVRQPVPVEFSPRRPVPEEGGTSCA